MDLERAYPYRSNLFVLALATIAGSMGLAAGGTAGALIAADMTGSTASAGLPLGLLVVGSAVGAVLISRRTQRRGRASGLLLGYALGIVGAAAVVAGAVAGSFGAVLAGSAVLGAANAAVFLSRYAAAEAGGEGGKGRALGVVLAATAVGAVASPNLLGPSGQLAGWLGLPSLTGLYLVAVPSFAIAGALVATLRRPNGAGHPAQPVPATSPSIRGVARGSGVWPACGILAVTNLVMVATMAVVPVHLAASGHDLESIGILIGVHVVGMFAPAPLTGWLADRLGGHTVAAVGAVLLVTGGVAGATADPHSGGAVMAALTLVGIGWNFGVVGGSTLLVASVPPSVRPHAEGIGEAAMGLAAGVGAPVAGLAVAFGGFAAFAAAGAAVSALALVAIRLVYTRTTAAVAGGGPPVDRVLSR